MIQTIVMIVRHRRPWENDVQGVRRTDCWPVHHHCGDSLGGVGGGNLLRYALSRAGPSDAKAGSQDPCLPGGFQHDHGQSSVQVGLRLQLSYWLTPVCELLFITLDFVMFSST